MSEVDPKTGKAGKLFISTEAQTDLEAAKPHFTYLGFALGSLHGAGITRQEIEEYVGKILDHIERVKADPEKLAKLQAGFEGTLPAEYRMP